MAETIAYSATPLLAQTSRSDIVDYGQLIAAHRAISGLEHALQFSPAIASSSFSEMVRLLDGLGAVQLDGEPIWLQSVIDEPNNVGVQRAHTFATIASSLAVSNRSTEITQSMAVQVARKLAGDAHSKDVLRLDSHTHDSFQHGLSHWEHFVSDRAGDEDSLVLTAIADAKFRRLCPFNANNNAAASLLMAAVMRNEQVLHHAPLCLANYFSRHAEQFSRSLTDDDSAVRFYLTAFTELALDLLKCLAHLVNHLEYSRQVVSETLSRAPVNQVMQAISRPVCTNTDLIEAGITRRQTSATYLKKLSSAGLLESRRQGKELRYMNNGFVESFQSLI